MCVCVCVSVRACERACVYICFETESFNCALATNAKLNMY